ncbi:MAG: DinB family protein [Anaerolineae bacterium]
MNADAFRYFYNYHFAENRKTWDYYITSLSDEQFTQEVNYSHGSVRNHIVHLMSVDDTWFSGLRGVEIPELLEPAQFTDRKLIRAQWDEVERKMRDYLAALRDEMLITKPLDGEDKNLLVWQVLLHVVNHATDHRAQILRVISDLGVRTGPQDYIFYVYDHP